VWESQPVITSTEIRQKIGRQYAPLLRAWLCGEPFFPLAYPVGKLPDDYMALRDAVQRLNDHARGRRGHGYVVEARQQQTRKHGLQTLPVRIIVETQQDFLSLIDKADEFERFCRDVALIRARLPQLEAWLVQYPQRVIEQHGAWPDLLAVCAYFLEHPRPDLYIRELPIAVHTKFIEQHRGILRDLLEQLLSAEAIEQDAGTFELRFGLREEEPLIHLRFLDNQLRKHYGLPLSEISVPRSQFAALALEGQRCIVTENKKTFLTLPPFPDTFAIFGGGFMVQNLARVPWLVECPILYWGDLDAQGFQILSALRSAFPHVTSVMMNETTLQAFADFCVEGTLCTTHQLPYLTPAEHALFLHLAGKNIRLEQERISHAYALACLRERFQTV